MQKILPLILIAIIILGGGYYLLMRKFQAKYSPETTTSQQTNTNQKEGDTMTQQNYSSLTVAEHNIPEDCWVIISGEVYDLTNFDQKHPGGMEAIRLACGKDATQVFETRGDRGPHPESAKQTLSAMKIGTLKNE